MATKRDYKAEYARRKERAVQRGYRSPREETQYQALKKTRQKKLTLYNFRQIQEAKRRKAAALRAKTKIRKTTELAKAKARVLKQFKLTPELLNKLRRQNRAFSAKTKNPKLLYNLALDEDLNNWSAERIGYIKYYNQVFVNPKPLKNNRRSAAERENANRLINKWDLFADQQDIMEFIYAKESKRKVA
jgi:hypothetical protein